MSKNALKITKVLKIQKNEKNIKVSAYSSIIYETNCVLKKHCFKTFRKKFNLH